MYSMYVNKDLKDGYMRAQKNSFSENYFGGCKGEEFKTRAIKTPKWMKEAFEGITSYLSKQGDIDFRTSKEHFDALTKILLIEKGKRKTSQDETFKK